MTIVCTNIEPINSPQLPTIPSFPPCTAQSITNYLVVTRDFRKLAFSQYHALVLSELYKADQPLRSLEFYRLAREIGIDATSRLMTASFKYLVQHGYIVHKPMEHHKVYYYLTKVGKRYVQSILQQLQTISSP